MTRAMDKDQASCYAHIRAIEAVNDLRLWLAELDEVESATADDIRAVLRGELQR